MNLVFPSNFYFEYHYSRGNYSTNNNDFHYHKSAISCMFRQTNNFYFFIVNGGANPSYQWFINGVAVQGGTNDTLIVDSLENNDIVTLNAYSDLTVY